MTIGKQKNLEQMFGGYFHQDWRDEFKSPEEAIKKFLAGSSKSVVKSTHNELTNLLGMNLSEEDLKNKLHELGSYYSPNKGTISSWLKEIERTLASV